jgi:hypothetical protein
MRGQDRLFRLAVEAGSINFWHEPGIGWFLVTITRRGDETWQEAETCRYQGLSTMELLTAVDAHLDSVL